MPEENILRRIRGDDVARAAKMLPVCSAESPSELAAVVDVPELGRVRIVFSRFRQKRGKLVRYFWTPERARRESGQPS